jgi:hypothetical protein
LDDLVFCWIRLFWFVQVDENTMDKTLDKVMIDNRTLTGIDWWWVLCPQDG